MKRYLLDTSVLSLLAPGRAGVSPALLNWFRAHGDQLCISTITVAEIQQGVSKLRRSSAEPRAERLSEWLHDLIEAGGERIINFDIGAALKAGEISDLAMARGRHLGFPDVAIAAVGAAFDMEILTFNIRHFEALEIAVTDPSTAAFLDAQ